MAPDPSDDRIGTLIAGRYRIDHALGAGGMGEVHAAVDVREGVEVAIKLLNPQLAREEQHLRRFMREAEVTSLLHHPHVVRALDSGISEDGSPYLVMELVRGTTLAAFMRDRQGAVLDVATVVSIARQIASALSAAAEINVIHRDLKPGNVMILETPGGLRAKVVDFGLARFLSSPTYRTLTLTGQLLGTPTYMSREQAFGERVSFASDVYAVGAIMHALLTGEPPYGRGPEVLARLLANQRTPLTESRPDLGGIAEVVERCLAPAPEDRYPSAAALDRALAGFEPGGTTVAEWVRPKILPSLVLAPDSLLDATPGLPEPEHVTPRPDRESSSGSRLPLLLLLGGLSFGVAVVAVVMSQSGGDAPPADAPADEPPSVDPVAMLPGDLPPVDAAVIDDASGSGTSAAPEHEEHAEHRERRGVHCPGTTGWDVWVEDGTSNDTRAAKIRVQTAIDAIDARCYSTHSVATRSRLRFVVARTTRPSELHFDDPGRLSSAERACVRRSLENVHFSPVSVGTFTFDLVGRRLRLVLDHRPACEPP